MSNSERLDYLKSICSPKRMEEVQGIKGDTKLYHYTSPEGLFSIIKNNTIRFTDYRFLNDKNEYKYMLIPLSSVIERIIDKIDLEILLGLFLFVINEIDNVTSSEYPDNIRLYWDKLAKYGYNSEKFYEYVDYFHSEDYIKTVGYVFSTSSVNDSLDMWNYYVKNGKYEGYNIGFTLKGILDCLNDSNIINYTQGSVIYSRNEQESMLEKIINIADNDFKNEKIQRSNNWDEYERLSFIKNSLSQMKAFIPFFKDNHFQNEQEYRFVLKINNLDEKCKNFITKSHFLKNGLIIPCCDVTINKENTIKTITISPIMEKMIAEIGVRSLLDQYNYKGNIEITQSTIPIRY